MSKVDLIEEDLWDHYSGLPNPAWYKYKKGLNDEEDDTDDNTDLGTTNEEIQENQKKKHMGPIVLSKIPTYDLDLKKYTFNDAPGFTPSYSPVEMIEAGVFGGNYFGNIEVEKNWKEWVPQEFLNECDHIPLHKLTNNIYDISINKYKVICGMNYQGWIDSGWIKEQDPYGWFNWYINFYYGRRSEDDNRQISRWKSFVSRHPAMLRSICKKAGRDILDESFGKKTRQGLLHWSYKI